MKIEKLNENKIRIILNIKDLEEKNIDFHSFMSNPIETQNLFADMLETAEKELGFITKNHQLSIDAIATSTGDFIVTVTRNGEAIEKRKVRVRRKEINLDVPIIIYSFTSFDDIISFCKFAKTNLTKCKVFLDKNTSLYELKNNYYIVFKNIVSDLEKVKHVCSSAAEFGTYVENADLYESKLKEYGNLIISKNVITNITKKF